MKIPETPPPYSELVAELTHASPRRLATVLTRRVPPEPNGRHYHWDKLRHLKSVPDGLTHREWWFGIKFARNALYRQIPHRSKDRENFVICETNNMRRLLHEIDMHGGGELKTSSQITNPDTRDSFLINSLIEEAITSSQLEGAATTRKVAKEMLRVKREPRDRSERMIVNNYHAMEFIRDIATEDLTPSIILELHEILTQGTLNHPDAVGHWRTNDETYVGDERDATVIHVPPSYKELPDRIESICRFANDTNERDFLHPFIRAALLHFLLAYDHPFEDGNGRTARALFYWSMMRQRYWTMEFVSISRILKLAPAQYTRSYLYTETDSNDVTYFVLHQLSVIQRAIGELLDYLKRKTEEQRTLISSVKASNTLNRLLNHRQFAVLTRALKNASAVFTIESHRGAHNITYETARTDLLKLEAQGLLSKTKRGKAFVFLVPRDLRERMEHFKDSDPD